MFNDNTLIYYSKDYFENYFEDRDAELLMNNFETNVPINIINLGSFWCFGKTSNSFRAYSYIRDVSLLFPYVPRLAPDVMKLAVTNQNVSVNKKTHFFKDHLVFTFDHLVEVFKNYELTY